MSEVANQHRAGARRSDLYVFNHWGSNLPYATQVARSARFAFYISVVVSIAGLRSLAARIVSGGNAAIPGPQFSHYVAGFSGVLPRCA